MTVDSSQVIGEINISRLNETLNDQANREGIFEDKDFELFNIHCNYAKNGLYLEGSKEFPLENINLDNVVIDEAEKPIDAALDTGSLAFRSVYINGQKFDSAN